MINYTLIRLDIQKFIMAAVLMSRSSLIWPLAVGPERRIVVICIGDAIIGILNFIVCQDDKLHILYKKYSLIRMDTPPRFSSQFYKNGRSYKKEFFSLLGHSFLTAAISKGGYNH